MMKKLPFKKMDAFATTNSEGNPAGCVFLENLNELSGEKMLQIAKELKGFVSEVGFIAPNREGEYDFKYYSSERELDFCGHVTIASMYDIASSGKDSGKSQYKINTNRGSLIVENRIHEEDSVFIMSPEPEYKDVAIDKANLTVKLQIDESDIADNPVTIINAGLNTLIVPIQKLECILNISPDLSELNEYCYSTGIDIIEVYCEEVYNDSNNFRTRVFAPTFGYIEDPATGSGNSAFGYYLLKNGLWKGETVNIEQNGKKEEYNLVRLQQKQDEKGNVRVWFGGGATTKIDGEYIVYYTR